MACPTRVITGFLLLLALIAPALGGGATAAKATLIGCQPDVSQLANVTAALSMVANGIPHFCTSLLPLPTDPSALLARLQDSYSFTISSACSMVRAGH